MKLFQNFFQDIKGNNIPPNGYPYFLRRRNLQGHSLRSRPGFSLVELMVVIGIVMLMTVLAVGAYSGARRSARLDTAADILIGAFKDAQLQAKTGRRAGLTAGTGAGETAGSSGGGTSSSLPQNQTSECHGLYLRSSGEETSSVEYVVTPYYAVRGREADFCDLAAAETRALDTVEDFQVLSLESLGSSVSELLFLMKPPSGNVVVGNMASVNAIGTVAGTPEVVVTVGLSGIDDTRTVRFQLVTGVAQRVYNAQ